MMKRFPAMGIFLVACCAFAQQRWQRIRMPTAAEVRRVWLHPPSEYGPEPYYSLNGAVDAEVIRRDLDTIHALGYRAVTVQAGYGMPFPYLSPQYFRFFRIFVQEARKRNLRIWIVDDAGYPSGFAGGKFTELKPKLRMQALVAEQEISANGGDVVVSSVGLNTVVVTALNLADGSRIQIPVANGKIAWKAPAGKWLVVVVEHRFQTSPTRSDTNPRRVKDDEQSLEDYMNPAATRQFLAFTHEQYKQAVGNEFGRTILGFRGDEPDYSISGLPWTPDFFRNFQKIKGYDIRPYLAAFLMPRGMAMTDAQKRAKADYYDVFSQMFRDGFFKPLGEWCAANRLEYQVHLNHEEMQMQLTRSEGDFFRDMKYVQVPGIDAIWHQIWTDTISDYPRLASSAAHVYGHPRAFTESFAAYRPTPDVAMARYILNEQFVRGVNLVETMYFAGSAGARGGPTPLMKDPAYPSLMRYVRRMSYLMSMGRPDASVALLLPSSSMWMGDADTDKDFVSTERLLAEHQIDFDIVGEDALAQDLMADAKAFTTMSGNRYRTVILPGVDVLSQAVLDRLHNFSEGGGHVLFLGRTPNRISDHAILNARHATPADFAWASVETSAQLGVTPTPPAYPPSAPPGPQTVPAAILKAVLAAVGRPRLSLDSPDTSLRCMARRWKDSNLYLFFNEGPKEISHSLEFHSNQTKVEEWDPWAGVVTRVPSVRNANGLIVQMKLQPYETRVLLLR